MLVLLGTTRVCVRATVKVDFVICMQGLVWLVVAAATAAAAGGALAWINQPC